MQNFTSNDILTLDKKTYSEYFENEEFGLSLGKEIALKHGYKNPLIRITEGSSLVFKIGSEHFLKITPPFSIPHILVNDQIANWKYVITKKVNGQQAMNVFRALTPGNVKTFAMDIGKTIKAINDINSDGFERDFGPWKTYLENNLKNQEAIHLDRGNTPEWSQKISRFVNEQTSALRSLGPAKLIHADLNHEHLMLEEVNNEWRVTGVLDFADSMNAPIEMEFILPIVCFFKGKPELQRLVWEGAEYRPKFNLNEYSNVMMALTLQNRFIAFHDWFDREIDKGAKSVEEVAAMIFPAL